MNHAPECLAYQERITAERVAYFDRWSKACRGCDARGGIEYREGHPYGSTIAYETLMDPCDECAGRCPRCGVDQPDEFYEDTTPCSACGYRWGEADDDVPPEPWDGACGCWTEGA